MRTHTMLLAMVRSAVAIVAAVTFAVMSGLVLVLLGLVLTPH